MIPMHSHQQYTKFFSLISYLNNSNKFLQLGDLYKFQGDKLNIEEFYLKTHLVYKKEVVANLQNFISDDVKKLFGTDEELKAHLLNVDNLSINHDRKITSPGGGNWYVEVTSGTTGKPFPIVKDIRQRLLEAKYLMSCRNRIAESITLENGFLLIHPVDPVLKKIQLRGSTSPQAKEKLKQNVHLVFEYLLKRNPRWIFCSMGVLRVLSDFISEYEDYRLLKKISLDFIEVTGQSIYNEDKDFIENLFNTKIVNNYGCREVWNIAYQCKYGRMHLNTEYLMVDIVDEEGNVIREGEQAGNVILTNLSNNVMPLIKYYLGDYGKIDRTICACGLLTPSIILEEGREKERLVNTPYFGSSIFRRVLRNLYFKEAIKDIVDIRIVQDGDFHLTVYINKESGKDSFFESKFIEYSMWIIGFDKFKVDFSYNYPFRINPMKELIFVSEIK